MITPISIGLPGGIFRLLPVLLLWSFAACSLPPTAVNVSEPQPSRSSLSQVGVASWYGPGFHGQTTASGVIYDQFELTAAHPTLPLGSHLAVTNLQNGKSIEVSINDRGPFVKGRIIDLSYAAAAALSMVGQGTTLVRIDVIHSELANLAAIPSRLDYTLQVGSFIDIEKAFELKGRLTKSFPWTRRVSIVLFRGENSIYFRVQLGTFSDRAEAERLGRRMAREGFPAIIMENWDYRSGDDDLTLHSF